MTVKEFVDEVYASYNRDKDTNYVFFLGAGCSKSSGIPLAGELAIEWFLELKKENIKFDRFIDEHIQDSDTNEKLKSVSQKEDIDDPLYDALAKLYFPLFEIVFPDMIDRQKEIQRLTEGKYPGLGYYNLAQLMKKKAFNVVITTNFDDLIYDALLYSGQSKRARVISHHHLSQFIDRGDTPHIIKLHGDAHLHPANDSQNTQEIDPTLAQSVQSLLNNSKLIVIGYSGGDESIAKLLSTVTRQATVYWCNQEPPTGTRLESWWNNLPHKQHVEEYDFDKIMNIFGDKFALEAPDFASFCSTLKSQYDTSFIKEAQEAIAEEDIEELNSLSAQSWRAGEYDKALELATKAMELATEKYGENHPSTATSYNNIGTAWDSKGEYDKAIEYYDKALKIKLATIGENHPSTATTYNNLGLAWSNMGEYDKAIEYYEKAFKIQLATIGDNHPDTAASYNNLGSAWGNKEEYDKAIEYYGKALKILNDVFPNGHPYIDITTESLELVKEKAKKNNKD